MMEKGHTQQYVEIRLEPFYNDDHINDHVDNTGRIVVA